MKTVVEERTLAAGDSPLAARLLLITGYKAKVVYTDWEDDSPLEVDQLSFPDKHEECWFSILGDNAMGSVVDIWNNEEGQLIVEGDFGDAGRYEFNLSTIEHLHMQKIMPV